MVKEIDLFDYLKNYSSLRTPLSDFYLKSKSCRIFGCRNEEGAVRGLLLIEPGEVSEILVLCAEGDDPAVKRELLDFLLKELPGGSFLRWRAMEGSTELDFAAEYGFSEESVLNLFKTIGAEDEALFRSFRKYDRMISFLEKRGYTVAPFNRLTPQQKSMIRNNPEQEFEDSLRPGALMDGIEGTISENMSFAALRDGKVAAYTIVRSPDGINSIFEIICVAKSERKSGVFILPFISSLKEMQRLGSDKAYFAIYDHNKTALDMVTKRFDCLIVSRTVQINMLLRLP